MVNTTRSRGGHAADAESSLSGHILPTSATMVGVCVTAIGIVRLMNAGSAGFYVDKLLAIDCVLFVGCSVLSFASARLAARFTQLEVAAELLFLVGLLILGIASMFLAFQVG